MKTFTLIAAVLSVTIASITAQPIVEKVRSKSEISQTSNSVPVAKHFASESEKPRQEAVPTGQNIYTDPIIPPIPSSPPITPGDDEDTDEHDPPRPDSPLSGEFYNIQAINNQLTGKILHEIETVQKLPKAGAMTAT